MTTTRYNSFKEIDERLKILKLRKEISGEHFKLDMHRIKNNFQPTNLLSGFGGFLQISILSFITNTLVKTIRKYRSAG